ncbi:glycosyltransferase [Shewanella baltica]|uniref:glycosyltransferase n=1 Tax=Shewanella baltica TaxID=62322 RepID=UPI003D7A69C9
MVSLPRVSLFIFCYQQADFIAQAVTAALAQDYSNLQIIISDDASADDTYRLVQAIAAQYRGSHHVTLNRNDQNLGIGRHFIHIMDNLVDGELVVASAGDDISAPNRVSRIVEEWLTHGKPALVAHGLEEINELGHLFSGSRTVQYRIQEQPSQWPQSMALHDYLRNPFPLPYIGAALAYRRDIYMQFGAPAAEPCYEDHLMYFRALLSDGMHYFPQVLVKYRRHANNFTAKPMNPKPRLVNIPLLFQNLLQETLMFAPDQVGVFRLHQLTTQQWLDYRSAVQSSKASADVDVVATLWQILISRHRRLLLLKGGIGGLVRILRYTALQVLWALRCRFGSMQYLYQDSLLAADYAPSLRTVVFGAGTGGERALANLSGGFHVVAVCDNNTKLHGGQFCGLPVISPVQLKLDIDTIDCIIVASTFFHEIKAKLTEELGIPPAKISRASYSCITQSDPSGVTTALVIPIVIITVIALLALVILVPF